MLFRAFLSKVGGTLEPSWFFRFCGSTSGTRLVRAGYQVGYRNKAKEPLRQFSLLLALTFPTNHKHNIIQQAHLIYENNHRDHHPQCLFAGTIFATISLRSSTSSAVLFQRKTRLLSSARCSLVDTTSAGTVSGMCWPAYCPRRHHQFPRAAKWFRSCVPPFS